MRLIMAMCVLPLCCGCLFIGPAVSAGMVIAGKTTVASAVKKTVVKESAKRIIKGAVRGGKKDEQPKVACKECEAHGEDTCCGR